MFYKAVAFNQAIGGWNTAKVTDSLLVFVVVHVLTQVPRTLKTSSRPKNHAVHFFARIF